MISLSNVLTTGISSSRMLGCSLITGLALLSSACGGQSTLTANTAAAESRSRDILEIQVTDSPDRENGQPAVMVNPKNPDNLVFVSTNHKPDVAPSSERFDCFAAYSTDGGETWAESSWPYGDRPLCGDPNLVVDSAGTFYVAFNRLGCPTGMSGLGACDGVPNHLAVAKSTDGGRTWSEPVDTPAAIATTPRLRLDAATDRLYAVGGVGEPRPHAVTTSTDDGLTWSEKGPLPPQPFGNQIAVHDDILATATALKIVDGRSVESTEITFWVSTDEGQTFTAFPVTDGEGQPVPPPTGELVPNPAMGAAMATDPIPWVSADPEQRGRFALMIPRDGHLEIYITDDAGVSWSGPAVVAAPGADKPWMEFGPKGLLGIMWRTKGVDVYSTVSCDDGRSFSPPLKVNQMTQPYADGGGEWSRILLHDQYAYVTWSDGRGGHSPEGIMARVPLSLYGCR